MSKTAILEDWKNRHCVLATMHSKEVVISPIFKTELGIVTVVPPDFNTDTFGTFTRDVKRPDDQLQTARTKALAAMKQTGLDLGLASEGSFGSHPSVPFLASNLEIVVLIDTKNNIEIVGHHRSNGLQIQSQEVRSADEAVQVAQSWGFPAQGVIIRTSKDTKRNIYKEITTLEELRTVSQRLLARVFSTSIFLETDMRAHRCPARTESIKGAAQDLVLSCQSLCSECSTPGFVVTNIITGLPCSLCGSPTEQATKLVHECQKCHHSENKPATDTQFADPGQCELCNP